MNTFEKGQVKVLIYRDESEDVWYGSALEFNLTIDGTDRTAVALELDHAIREYIISAREINDVSLLNQEIDPELAALWESRINNTESSVQSPYTPYLAGIETLNYA